MTSYTRAIEDVDVLERGAIVVESVPIHYGRIINPEVHRSTTTAWIEDEDKVGINSNIGEFEKLLNENFNNNITKKCEGKSENTKRKPAIQVNVLTKWQKYKQKIWHYIKPPVYLTVIVTIMIIVHLSTSRVSRQALMWSPGPWWQQPWRVISYGIVHRDFKHLSLNVVMANILGWCLEREQSSWRIALLWLGGLAAGSLGAGIFQPEAHVVGASAAIFALLTSHIPNTCLRHGYIKLVWFRILSVVVLCLCEVASSIYLTYFDHMDGIAWSSHLCGGISGVLVGFIVYTGENKDTPPLITYRIGSIIIIFTGLVLTAIYYSLSKPFLIIL